MSCQKGETEASQIHPDEQQPNQHDDKRNGAPLNEQKCRVRFTNVMMHVPALSVNLHQRPSLTPGSALEKPLL